VWATSGADRAAGFVVGAHVENRQFLAAQGQNLERRHRLGTDAGERYASGVARSADYVAQNFAGHFAWREPAVEGSFRIARDLTGVGRTPAGPPS